MRTCRFVLLACLMASLTHRAMAVPIAFDFSFLDLHTGHTVSGVVSGLQDNATASASSVFVSYNSGGYGIGEYIGDPLVNSWTVINGEITLAFFLVRGIWNMHPDVVCCSLVMAVDPSEFSTAALSTDPTINKSPLPDTVLAFTPRSTNVVPVPSALALLGAGLFGLVVSRRKRKLDI